MDSANNSTDMLRLNCPHCSKRLKVPEAFREKKSLKCPKCNQPIELQKTQPDNRLPPVLAETLPYVKPEQSKPAEQLIVSDAFDYLSDYQPAGPLLRLGAFYLDLIVFTAVWCAFYLVLFVAYAIYFYCFSSISPMLSSEAYETVGEFLSALLLTALNIFSAGSAGLVIELMILNLMNIGIFLLAFYVSWVLGCKILVGPWQATVGKRMFGMIVVDESGAPVTLKQATKRWLYKLLSMGCFCLGTLGIQKYPHQTWYDRMAKTQVLCRANEYHA